MSGSSATTTYAVQDLVALALRQLGVGAQGTTPSSADLADGVMHLNMMLAQWQRRRWMVPNLVDVSAMSLGTAIHLIGPGNTFDIPVRPERIDGAFARWTGAGFAPADFDPADFSPEDYNTDSVDSAGLVFDYPLRVIGSYEDYAAIRLKNLRTWPAAVFYDPIWPVGELRFWPIPAVGQWELHLLVKTPLPSSLTLATPLNLPPEYWDAIMWSLAARMAPSYGQEPSPTIIAQARAAEQTLRVANTNMPRLRMPAAVGNRRGAGSYPSIMTGWF